MAFILGVKGLLPLIARFAQILLHPTFLPAFSDTVPITFIACHFLSGDKM